MREVRRIARARGTGFTLIEMAVAVFILALLLGSILVPLATQVEQRQVSDTQRTMDEIKEALIGFAVTNGYLPCPDTDGDGISNPAAAGVCTNAEGWVPWVTLNVSQGDAWGNRFRYRVSPEFTNVPGASGSQASCVPAILADGRIALCKSGNISVSTRNAAKAVQALGSSVVAIILSHGKNGYGATSTGGVARLAVPAGNADETENNDGDATFMSRPQIGVTSVCSDTAGATPLCEFDDIVTWLSAYTLFTRMVAAGKLP